MTLLSPAVATSQPQPRSGCKQSSSSSKMGDARQSVRATATSCGHLPDECRYQMVRSACWGRSWSIDLKTNKHATVSGIVDEMTRGTNQNTVWYGPERATCAACHTELPRAGSWACYKTNRGYRTNFIGCCQYYVTVRQVDSPKLHAKHGPRSKCKLRPVTSCRRRVASSKYAPIGSLQCALVSFNTHCACNKMASCTSTRVSPSDAVSPAYCRRMA